MDKHSLMAVSPIDGRYHTQTSALGEWFSEYALIKYRIRVEILYFIGLCEIQLPQLAEVSQKQRDSLLTLADNINDNHIKRVKDIEVVTNHDVKAVEYLLREEFEKLGMGEYKEYIHFGLTSQDINNTAMPMMLRDALQNSIEPVIESLMDVLTLKALEWKNIPMLSRTHGQPATPTLLGKEIMVFVERLNNQMQMLRNIPIAGKFGGASGNFNAHHVAFPQINWIEFANRFLSEKLGLQRLQFTTQIEHYDFLAAIFDNCCRINTILIDFNRDIWTYLSMDYFKQTVKEGEVGSSAMPHKVNPIDFENSEGNLGLANAIFAHLSSKLPISRLQRDLTDSTVSRNIGVPFAHTLIGLKSCLKGLGNIVINNDAIESDLEKNWSVVAEAIQTVLRRENYPDPYNALKKLTRTNEVITKEFLHKFILNLNVSEAVKSELLKISPHNYTGINLL